MIAYATAAGCCVQSLHYEGALGSFCICTLALMCTSNSLTITYILVILSFSETTCLFLCLHAYV